MYEYMEPDYQLVANNSTLYITLFAIIFLFSVILNVTLLLVFIRNPILISPAHLYYINLACTNISFALFAMTFGVVTSMSGRWIFPDIVCQLVGFFHSLFLYIIMLTSFALISERYSYRISQTRYNASFTSKRVGLTIGLHWLLSLLLSSTPFIPGLSPYTLHNNKGTCFVPEGIQHYTLTLILFVYIILWTYVSYSTVFISKIPVPKQLVANRRSDTFLPALLTSGVFTLISLTYVVYEIMAFSLRYLQRGSLEEIVQQFEKISFLLLYVATLVQPGLIMMLNGDIRSGCANILTPRQVANPLINKPNPPISKIPPANHTQMPHQTLDRYQKPRWSHDKRYMSLPMVSETPHHMTTKHHNSHVIPLQPMAVKNTAGQQSGTLKTVQQTGTLKSAQQTGTLKSVQQTGTLKSVQQSPTLTNAQPVAVTAISSASSSAAEIVEL